MNMKRSLIIAIAAAVIAVAMVAAVCGAPITPGTVSAAGDPAVTPFGGKSFLSATPAGPGGTKLVTITDPVLNMPAFSLTIPSNWIFEGAVFPGTSCNDGPFPVFRLTTPDGLIGIKQLPRLDWSWSENPRQPSKAGPDCLPYKKEISAAEMLKYMVGVLQVEFVKDEPTPDLAEMQKSAAAQNSPQMFRTVDKARATVRYHINKIVMDERLNVFVSCTTLRTTGYHNCNAGISRTWAPQGKYVDDTYRSISKTFAVDQQWMNARGRIAIQKLKDLSDQELAMIKKQGEEAERRSKAQYNAFQQSQAMHQRQHEDFMASMQRGTDMSMKRAADISNTNHRIADDWCDYSLDQQKRLDPRTGEITKDSSAYSYTWINEFGEHYQTNDFNDNPNGGPKGNWNIATNVQ
jgi:hypothetical protein